MNSILQVNPIEKKSILFTILSKNLTDYSTKQYFHIEFSFKFFDKINDKQNGQTISTNRFNCLSEVLIELTIELHITLL